MTLNDLNRISRDAAIGAFEKCCGAKAWAARMADARPFNDRRAMHEAADRIWNALSEKDQREAFDHHPRIGGVEELRKKFALTGAWAGEEQSGVASATDVVLRALAEGNARYEARYGHIFLVCATGKSAPEMLSILESRMVNDPLAEFKIATAEQAKITRIRLEKLVS